MAALLLGCMGLHKCAPGTVHMQLLASRIMSSLTPFSDPKSGSSTVSCSQMGQTVLPRTNAGLQVWSETFEKWLGPIPKALHGPCCAEFIVSRDRIEAHPRCTILFHCQ